MLHPKPKDIADSIVDFYTNDREVDFAKNTSIEKLKFSWEKLVESTEDLVINRKIILFFSFYILQNLE